MARVRIYDVQTLNWKKGADLVDADMLSTLNQEERSMEVRYHEPGGDDRPQLFEARFPADMVVELHAHHEDEIIYVQSGFMKLGQRLLGPGSSLYVCGDTLYTFTAGGEGLHILNFRPRRDDSYLKKDAFLSYRATAH